MIEHRFTAKPWKTPIDDRIFFDVEFVLYRQNNLLIILLDARNNQKYSITVSGKIHLRYIHDNCRFSIWSYPEWQKLVKNRFTCGILTNSNFQLSIIGSKNMLNYFLITDSDGFEILTHTEPLISPVNNEKVEILISDFIRNKDITSNFTSALGKKVKSNQFDQSIKCFAFDSILNDTMLYFEFLIFSNKGINFVVTDASSKNRYLITADFRCAFQCVQLPAQSRDYSMIRLTKPASPLWKLNSSQLLTEANDHEVFLDKNDFGSLCIKTANVEIECVTKKPPQISLENRELSDLVKALLIY